MLISGYNQEYNELALALDALARFVGIFLPLRFKLNAKRQVIAPVPLYKFLKSQPILK
jgi:hypothetical protein